MAAAEDHRAAQVEEEVPLDRRSLSLQARLLQGLRQSQKWTLVVHSRSPVQHDQGLRESKKAACSPAVAVLDQRRDVNTVDARCWTITTVIILFV